MRAHLKLPGTTLGTGGVNTDVTFAMQDPDASTALPTGWAVDLTRSHTAPLPAIEERPNDRWFGDLYRLHRRDTVRLARLLTGSAAVAEDLAHEAFIRVYRRDGSLDEPVSFLRTVTVNVCRDWHRGRRREQLRAVRHGPNADRVSLAARELDASLARLPYQERAVIVLRYWLDLSEAEIAAALGCRPGTVKSRHARALHKLNKELDQ
jgi:RNA polymerase sigma factor (sigma-70 family)